MSVGKKANASADPRKQSIGEHNQLLLETLVISYELLNTLQGHDYMDEATKEQIFGSPRKLERNRSFLIWLKESPSSTINFVLEQLRHEDEKQGHVANIIEGEKGELPLSPKVKKGIQRCTNFLVKKINPDEDLVTNLWSAGGINQRDYDDIRCGENTYIKVQKLLDVILRGSSKTYETVLIGLDKSGQGHVVSELRKRIADLQSEASVVNTESADEIIISEDKDAKEKLKQLKGQDFILFSIQGVSMYVLFADAEATQTWEGLFETRQRRQLLMHEVINQTTSDQKILVRSKNDSTEILKLIRKILSENEIGGFPEDQKGLLDEKEIKNRWPHQKKKNQVKHSDECRTGYESSKTITRAAAIAKQRNFLEDRMDLDFGLLNKLCENSILPRRILHFIQDSKTANLRNKKLLDYILANNKAAELMMALRDTGQTHLVNYLNADGDYNPEFGDDWPLDERFSLRQYKETIECRHTSNQSHVAEILSDAGVIVEILANLVGFAREEEETVFRGITDDIKDQQPSELDDDDPLRELLKLRLIRATRVSEGIVLYFKCLTIEEFTQLRYLFTDGRLECLVFSHFLQQKKKSMRIIGRIIGLLKRNTKSHNITLYWSNVEYHRSLIYFSEKFNVLPLEMVDMILLKVCRMSMLSGNESIHKRRDTDIICAFASVDECWSKRILRIRFKQRIMRYLTEFCRKFDRVNSSESKCILMDLRVKADQIDRFRSADCMTDREARLINAQTHDIDRNEELLEVVQSLDAKRYNRFIYELMKTDRRVVAHLAGLAREGLISYKEHPVLKTTIGANDKDRQPKKREEIGTCNENPVSIPVTETHDEIPRHRMIKGVAILEEELFVISRVCSEVDVYNAVTSNFNRSFRLSQLVSPWDICSAPNVRCLYIMDGKHKGESSGILRVNPNGKMINKWSTGEHWGSLSVTEESNVILTAFYQNKLNCYSPNGQLIRKISIYHPGHALQLCSGIFVVSHTDRNDRLHRVVSIVDDDGNVFKSFGGKRVLKGSVSFGGKRVLKGSVVGEMYSFGGMRGLRGSAAGEMYSFREMNSSAAGEMNYPVYLAVDEDGSIMVTDPGNKSVLLLSSTLEYKKEILSGDKHDLQGPSAIHMVQSNGQLFVVDSNPNSENGRICIYKVK